MLPKDNAYTVMKKHMLPLNKGNKIINEFLLEYYDEYVNDISNAIASKENRFFQEDFYINLSNLLPLIKENCKDIIKLLELYNRANLKELYEHLSISIDKIKGFLYIQTIPQINCNFYRIRPGENDGFKRKDLFHIPMNERQKIKPYRYSIAGYPCLYLSTGIELCWFECGMPKKFSVSQFRFDPIDKTRKLSLINFSYNPIDLYSNAITNYYNKSDKDKIDDYILKHFISHPLRAACSIIATNKSTPFIEEYILPQLFLLWVRESKEYDGIIYSSASSIEEASDWNYYNVVLPAKEADGAYCSYLKQSFKISKPVKCNVGEIFKKHSDKVNKVREFAKELDEIYIYGKALYLHREILSTCKTFLLFYDCISSENYSDPEPLYQMMDTINLLAYMINDNKDAFCDVAVKKGIRDYPDLNKLKIRNKFDSIVEKFIAEIKPILLEFWGVAFKLGCEIDIDESSHEHLS